MIEIKGEKYYTPREVSIKFNVAIGTIARWRQEGKLNGHKISSHKFIFSETDLEKMIKGENNAI